MHLLLRNGRDMILKSVKNDGEALRFAIVSPGHDWRDPQNDKIVVMGTASNDNAFGIVVWKYSLVK